MFLISGHLYHISHILLSAFHCSIFTPVLDWPVSLWGLPNLSYSSAWTPVLMKAYRHEVGVRSWSWKLYPRILMCYLGVLAPRLSACYPLPVSVRTPVTGCRSSLNSELLLLKILNLYALVKTLFLNTAEATGSKWTCLLGSGGRATISPLNHGEEWTGWYE